MKFSVVLALAAAATVVSAETNAQRMARGLPPMPPAKRASPVQQKRHKPSSVPPPPPTGGQCNTGDVMCCNSFQKTTAHGGTPVDNLLTSLGLLNLPVGTNCGLSCDPITAIGTGSGAVCQSQPVCCENNDYNGLINIGCSPINVNA